MQKVTMSIAEIKAILDALLVIEQNLPQVNVTKAQRDANQNIQEGREPYVEKVMNTLGPDNPGLINSFQGTLAEAQANFILYTQLQDMILKALKTIVMMTDAQFIVGTETFSFVLGFYKMAQEGTKGSYPGAQAIVDALSPLFAGQGPQKPIPPAAPVTPA